MAASTATLKSLGDIALCLGLVAQIEDKYKGKEVQASIKRVKKEGEKLFDFWPEKLNIKEVKKIERKILSLEKWLDKKEAAVFTSTALAVISDSKQYWKDEVKKQAEIFETRIFTLHKRIDRFFNKNIYHEYAEANNTAAAWRGL